MIVPTVSTQRRPLWRYNLLGFELIKMKAKRRLPFTARPKRNAHFPSLLRPAQWFPCSRLSANIERNSYGEPLERRRTLAQTSPYSCDERISEKSEL
jgi:hypothetical protein